MVCEKDALIVTAQVSLRNRVLSVPVPVLRLLTVIIASVVMGEVKYWNTAIDVTGKDYSNEHKETE